MIGSKTDIPDLIELLDVKTLHVHSPTQVVVVCGGYIDIEKRPQSLRDALLRSTLNSPLSKYKFSYPEQADIKDSNGLYTNWHQFEADMAQASSLIILFSEAYGAFAELGSFVDKDEIARKLLVVISQNHFEDNSYIRYGPVASLLDNYGQDKIYVLYLEGLGIDSIKFVETINISELGNRLSTKIIEQIQADREPRTFDKDRIGHVIKLVTGLTQHFGALKVGELEVALYCLGIESNAKFIGRVLWCAEFYGWVKSQPSGSSIYYVAQSGRKAIEYSLIENTPPIDKDRWKWQIREYWVKADPDRARAISAATTGGAPK